MQQGYLVFDRCLLNVCVLGHSSRTCRDWDMPFSDPIAKLFPSWPTETRGPISRPAGAYAVRRR